MNERQKLEEVASQLQATREAVANAARRQADETAQKQYDTFCGVRTKLKELANEYGSRVGVFVSEHHYSFRVAIGSVSPVLRKPFASLNVSINSSGIYISNGSHNGSRYEVASRTGQTAEDVADAIRSAAAEYLLQRHSLPYEFPEWYTVLVTIAAGLIAGLSWLLCALLFGLSGVLLGWIPMIITYKVLRAVGPVGILVALGGYGYYLIVEGSK